MARSSQFSEGFSNGYQGMFPKYPKDHEYLRGYTRGRDERMSEHRTFSDAAVISDGMKRSSSAQCGPGGSNLNRSIGSVEQT